jgi:hypothetical protein
MASTPVNYALDSEAGTIAEIWTARFSKTGTALPDYLRIFWAWNATGSWEAPQSPRLAFGRYPARYKLYVLRNLTSIHDRLDEDRCLEFMRQLLPELSRTLCPQDRPVAGERPLPGICHVAR